MFSFITHVQEKFIAKLMNSKVNFTRKTELYSSLGHVIHAISVFRVKFTVEFTS